MIAFTADVSDKLTWPLSVAGYSQHQEIFVAWINYFHFINVQLWAISLYLSAWTFEISKVNMENMPV